jgi:hypothetical protein
MKEVSNEIKHFLDKLDQLEITRVELRDKITIIRKMVMNHLKYEHTGDEARMIRCLKAILYDTNQDYDKYHKERND